MLYVSFLYKSDVVFVEVMLEGIVEVVSAAILIVAKQGEVSPWKGMVYLSSVGLHTANSAIFSECRHRCF